MPVLIHPKLPDQPITVAERSVRHHERAGWRRIETPVPVPPGDRHDEEQPEHDSED